MIVAPPAGDAFNFSKSPVGCFSRIILTPVYLVVDLQVYPSSAFNLAMAIGLFVVRWRRKRLGLPRASYRAWNASVLFAIAVYVYLLVMPWYPPDGGAFAGDVSFWYATYVVAGIGIIAGCGVYYALWIYVLPKLRKYSVRQIVIVLENGEQTHKIVKVPNVEVAQWDATHDAVGREIGGTASERPSERPSDQDVSEVKV